MIKDLAVFERSYCSCAQCKLPCTTRPGCLAPSDIDHIAEYTGNSVDGAFLALFEAHEDGPRTATDKFPDGRTPAIRPAMLNGKCVFHGDNGECTIHAVAPFECSRVNNCRPEEGSAAMKKLGTAIAKSADYVMLWTQLRK